MSLRFPRASLIIGCVLALAACDREERATNEASAAETPVSPTEYRAGSGPQSVPKSPLAGEYENNAFHVSEGKRYYEWFNCYGCHAAGGGDIGPPLMDDRWRYGGEIEQIRSSILEGRPNGMPSFRGVIPDQQVWEIAAYVRSMSGNVPKDVPPSRGDEINSGPPKTQVWPAPPVNANPGSDDRTGP